MCVDFRGQSCDDEDVQSYGRLNILREEEYEFSQRTKY